MIKKFLFKYKTPLIAVVLVWVSVLAVQWFVVRPLKLQNSDLKTAIKKREKINEQLKAKVTADSLTLIENDKRIEAFEADEQKYKDLQPKIQIKYEKAKTDYISRPLNERRSKFAKLANE